MPVLEENLPRLQTYGVSKRRASSAAYFWSLAFSIAFLSWRASSEWSQYNRGGSELLAGGLLIIGTGVDIAEVPRIRSTIERRGEAFLRRIYTPAERAYCERFKNKFERYAGRFAVKEAAMKALGTGWSHGVRWVDLEVIREKSGRPTLAIRGEAGKIAARLGVKNIAVSITHTGEQALAQVIFEG